MFPATDKEGGAWLMNVISFETDNDKSTVNLMNVISFKTDHDKSTVNLMSFPLKQIITSEQLI